MQSRLPEAVFKAMNEIVKQGKAHRALGWGDNSEDRKKRAMRSAQERA